MNISRLQLERIGQISCAEVEFGDLTVLVGPQATGKSIFLQFLKLVVDTGYVHEQFRKHGIEWRRTVPDFLDRYLGEGMCEVWREGKSGSSLRANCFCLTLCGASAMIVTVQHRAAHPPVPRHSRRWASAGNRCMSKLHR